MASFPAEAHGPGEGAAAVRKVVPSSAAAAAAAPPAAPAAAVGAASSSSSGAPSPPRFSAEQVSCVCEALVQAGDPGRLGRFVGSLPAEAELELEAAAASPGESAGESVAKARALLAFERGDFGELYRLVGSRPFGAARTTRSCRTCTCARATGRRRRRRGRALGAVDKATGCARSSRCPPPSGTARRPSALLQAPLRAALRDSYGPQPLPQPEQKRRLAATPASPSPRSATGSRTGGSATAEEEERQRPDERPPPLGHARQELAKRFLRLLQNPSPLFVSCSESDGHPSTEDESSHGPEETDAATGVPATPEGIPASSSLFLPAACSSASSILLNGNFITASSPTMLLNGGSVIQTPGGGVILNGLALGDNQTLTLSPVAAPSPPVLLNGSTTLVSGRTPAASGQEVPTAPLEPFPPTAIILGPTTLPEEVKSEAAESLAFGLEVKSEVRPVAHPPLPSLPNASTLLSDHKGALLTAVPMSQIVPTTEDAPSAIPLPPAAQLVSPSSPQMVPLAKLVPGTQALSNPQVAVATVGGQVAMPTAPPVTAATPLLSIPGSSPGQAAVLHVPAPSLLPLAQVSPPSQVVPLSQPVSASQVLSPSQMVPVSPTQIYTVPQGGPGPQLISFPQVAQGSQIISLPQVVPSSQVVTLQQGMGSPIQILTSAAPIKVAGAPQAPASGGGLAHSNVHLINANMSMTALQLPGTTPGNILLTNPATGSSTIVTGMALQQGKLILTATFPASMLMTPILSSPAAPTLALPVKQEVPAPPPAALEEHEASHVLLPGIGRILPSAVPSLSASDSPGSPDLAFGTDSGQAGLLSGFSQPESLTLPQQQVVWSNPVSVDLQGPSSTGLFEMDKGSMDEQGSLLQLPEAEGLLLDASGGDPMDPEALDSDEKVLTQLQSVPVEEPLDL
uniref:Uncharacterized protein n=1 Tax=Sphaerodactylus townsendi TaxID=933632 RepID=A0ACB8FSZ4_9SAUR